MLRFNIHLCGVFDGPAALKRWLSEDESRLASEKCEFFIELFGNLHMFLLHLLLYVSKNPILTCFTGMNKSPAGSNCGKEEKKTRKKYITGGVVPLSCIAARAAEKDGR